MTVSERAIGSALGWPTPLACLYSLAMETGIGIRDYWHENSGIAAIVNDGQVIALSCGLADDGLRADVLAMALEVAIAMTNRPGTICAPGGFAVITPHRVPAPAAGTGKFATLMARACGRDTTSAAFEYYVPGFPGDGREPGAARSRLTAAGRLGSAACQLRDGPGRLLCCRLALVLKDLIRGQRPVPEHPPEQAMAHFLRECGRRHSQHRAPGVGQAVAAYLAADHPGQRTAVACPHHEQVIRGGDGNQDPACLAALDEGLDWRVSRDVAPCCGERIPQALMGGFRPDAAQVATRCAPVGEITARRHPGQDGY